MEHNIVRKLRNHLSGAIDTECTVLYLLAEIRKLIKRDKPEPSPFTLHMYCHWALHVNLSKRNTTKDFLGRVDKFILKTVFPYEDDGTFSSIDEHHLVRDFVYLDTLRRELKGFLDCYDLPTRICDDDCLWFALVGAYANIIEDGELAITGKGDDTLKAVDKVVFRKGGTPPAGNHVPFTIRWDIYLKDGRVCRTEVEANPRDSMIAHGLQIFRNATALNL